MGRILAIDYGRRRCGIAVTDAQQIVGNSLTTVTTATLEKFLKEYTAKETVDRIIIGYPRNMNGDDSQSMTYIRPAVARLKKLLPNIPIEMFDERFTSVLAHRSMIDGGMKKQKRRDKSVVDTIAATIILNDYLQSNRL